MLGSKTRLQLMETTAHALKSGLIGRRIDWAPCRSVSSCSAENVLQSHDVFRSEDWACGAGDLPKALHPP